MTPWTVACQAPLSMGLFKKKYWSGLPCPPPRDLPNPGTELESLRSPSLAGGFFITSPTWEAQFSGAKAELTQQKSRSHGATFVAAAKAPQKSGNRASSFCLSSSLLLVLHMSRAQQGTGWPGKLGNAVFRPFAPGSEGRIKKRDCGAERQETLVSAQVFPRTNPAEI